MLKKIDFSLFEQAKPETVSGGLLHEGLTMLLPVNDELQSVINLVGKNTICFWVSDGSWSMHDMLVSLLNITGPAELFIATYAMSETPARIITQLKAAKQITRLTTILDNRVDTRSAGSFQLMKAMSDEMVMVDVHAKVTLIINENWQLAVIGSANYTENKRFETGIIAEANNVVELQKKWMLKALKDGIKQ
jgi:hypothetical protein